MRRRRDVLRTVGAFITLGIAGCAGSTASTDGGNTRTVTDGIGRSVTIPETIERVVAVGPGALRQVAYLEATDRVVGVEDSQSGPSPWGRTIPYNLANPELRDRPVIGSAGPNAAGNSEAILDVNPDVIFYFGDPSRARSLETQTETPVVVLKIVDFVDETARETMYSTWRLVGRVLDKPDRAEDLIEFVDSTIRDFEDRTDDIPPSQRESAYVGAINYKGAHGIETTRNPFSAFRFVNVQNVAAGVETDAASVQISTEQLLTWDPPAIFVSADNLGRVREDVTSNAALQEIDAISNDETYSILPHASYHHNYGSILANACFIGQTLYPDQFEDLAFESQTNEIFEGMLGVALYDKLMDAYEAYRPLEF